MGTDEFTERKKLKGLPPQESGPVRRKKKPEEESSEEESSDEEDSKKPKKKISDVFNERKKMQVQLPPQETGPIRRKKKPVEEEEPVVVAPVVEVESAPPVVEEELLEAPEEIVEVESAPPLEEVDGPQLAGKDKVRDEFKEKDKKPKGEAEKIVIKPAVLKVKGKPEEEESSSEEEEEEEKAPAKKKLSKADLKPAVQIKMAAEPEAPTLRRKKKDVDEESTDPFAGLPAVKPKIKDEFTEKDKKPEESSSEEEEEEVNPEPKKKLSRSDLKP